MINETTMEMTLEMILELTSDQAEIGDPDGCPLTVFPVTIAELNKPLSYALRKEDLQISALAHNTLRENNIKSGDIVNVPNAESEPGISFINTKPIFKVNEPMKCVQK